MTTSDPVEGLQLSVRNGVRTIRINRPERKNALTLDIFKGIGDLVRDANNDDNTRIVVLTGTGDYFTSGNDLANFMHVAAGGIDPMEMAKSARDMIRDVVDAFIYCDKIIVAIVNGPAVGIGVTWLPLCDAVFCSDKATFRTPFTSLGQNPEACSSFTFPRIMGPARANEMLLFNQKITAAQADAYGLVTKVIPEGLLQIEAWSRIEDMTKLPPNSLRYTKQLIREMDRDLLHEVNVTECQRLEERFLSEECINAITEFFMGRSKM